MLREYYHFIKEYFLLVELKIKYVVIVIVSAPVSYTHLYRIVDKLPNKIPDGRKAVDFQTIKIQDQNILSTDSMVLENGTVVTFYSIDVYISHIKFYEDFGIHITTTSEVTK